MRGMLKFYKSIGALQVEFIPPKFNEKGYLEKDGAVLLTLAPGNKDKDNPEWDWTKKIVFALGVPDIAVLLTPDDNGACKCFHKTADATKKLELAPGKNSGWALTLSSNGKANLNAMVFLTDAEVVVLRTVIARLLPRVCGFVGE